MNLREASSLAARSDFTGAESLAQKLTKAASMLEVYPLLIEKCIAKKDQACASIITAQALKQLKQADTTLFSPPAGIPLSILPTSREFDPILLSLSKFAKAVAPVNDTQAIEILNEMVSVANHSETDTGQGWIGFEPDVFKILAATDSSRTEQAALFLKDRLRRITALATVGQWKATRLSEKTASNQERWFRAHKRGGLKTSSFSSPPPF